MYSQSKCRGECFQCHKRSIKMLWESQGWGWGVVLSSCRHFPGVVSVCFSTPICDTVSGGDGLRAMKHSTRKRQLIICDLKLNPCLQSCLLKRIIHTAFSVVCKNQLRFFSASNPSVTVLRIVEVP